MNAYDEFLVQLRELRFCTVATVLKRRDDLVGFRMNDGRWTTPCDPWFGDTYATLTDEERARAEMQYRYYCGHADDVFYRKPTRSDKRACFMPALSECLTRQTLPVVGETIFGHIDEEGPEGRRFFWWNFATKQERNFADLLSGRETSSAGKLEKKLVVSDSARPNWSLFLLAKALHFHDIGYFADVVCQHGECPRHLHLGLPLTHWLFQCGMPRLAPEFWQGFKDALHA